MTVVFAATYALLGAAGVCILVRMMRGPSTLDRILALDVLQILLIVAVAVEAGRSDSPTLVTILLIVTLLAFVASVTAARFVGRRTP